MTLDLLHTIDERAVWMLAVGGFLAAVGGVRILWHVLGPRIEAPADPVDERAAQVIALLAADREGVR